MKRALIDKVIMRNASVIFISVLFSILLLGCTENEIREASSPFAIGWYDPIKAIFGGLVLGLSLIHI